jgi:HPt (histidine-containing phosphotransfer) domain-containing protein
VKTEEQLRAERMAAARARMAELALKFIERTKAELTTIRAASKAGGPESIAEIRHLAHRMAGTGATLGFDALSDHAARIEVLCDAHAPGLSLTPEARVQVDLGADQIAMELRKLERAQRS